MTRYGERDAISILMGRGHRVALRWRGGKRWWTLDGQPVRMAQLEDTAEQYERIRSRNTPRAGQRSSYPTSCPQGPSDE